MKSRYVSLRKNPAGSPENKKISYPGKGTRFGKHLFITCLKIEYTLCICLCHYLFTRILDCHVYMYRIIPVEDGFPLQNKPTTLASIFLWGEGVGDGLGYETSYSRRLF